MVCRLTKKPNQIVTFVFLSLLSSLVRSKYLSLFSLSFIFNLWFAVRAKLSLRILGFVYVSVVKFQFVAQCPVYHIPESVRFGRIILFRYFSLFFLIIKTRSLLRIWRPVCISKFDRIFIRFIFKDRLLVCAYHHVVPLARISLSPSGHFSLSFIASGRFLWLHSVSSHNCCMYVRTGCPAFAWPYAGVHRSTSLMSSSLLLQQCPAFLVRLTCVVLVMGGRWPYSWCLVGCCRQDLFNIARNILV